MNFEGERFTNALAGATTLAAMLVVMVAREIPMIAKIVVVSPPILPRSWIGFVINSPKITGVEDVTARPTNVNSPMKIGSPACPIIWDFCDFA